MFLAAGGSPLVEQMVLPDLVPDAEGIQGAEGVGHLVHVVNANPDARSAGDDSSTRHLTPFLHHTTRHARDETSSPSVSTEDSNGGLCLCRGVGR